MLELKFKRASQAIHKNNALLVCSGSGMTADCPLLPKSPSYEGNCLPIFRGTAGLWRQYPKFRQELVLFDDLVEASFFK